VLRRSGLGPAAIDQPPMFTGFSVTARDGIRVSAPSVLNPAPDVRVAQSYDFGDFAFIQTSAGVVAIDAGTSPDRVLAAMADLGLTDQAPVSHLILTHAHLDHIGGSEATRGPDTQVIASAGFPAEAERLRRWNLPFRYFTGTGASPAFDVQPGRLISERTSVVVGDTEFVLIPVRGGETADALLVFLPGSGLLFTGDALMPYLGVPFTAEGSPEGLLDTMRYIRELAPRQLIQGHTTLTENFTIETLTGLESALTELHEFTLARIGENMPLPNILDLAYLPALLRDHPAAVVPYLVSRDDFIARLYHQRTGYWQPDGQGIDPRSQEETAAALDLLAGGKADAFVTAAGTLAGQGDLALGDPQVKALVYVDAFAPAQGQTLAQLLTAYPGSCAVPANLNVVPFPGAPSGVGDAYIKQSVYPGCMANDLPAAQAHALAATQRPIATSALTEQSGVPAWQTIPSWAVVGTADHAIPLALQLAMDKTAHAHITTVDASHLSMISNPGPVNGICAAPRVSRSAHLHHDLLIP
jgi:glyoxylase-like metal-dependent hydrolase (beta-lactamase superfamily II)